MPKTKPFSFRIDIGLYSAIKGLTESFNLTFSEVIEKGLAYFRHNPEEILNFPTDARLIECSELEKNPERSLQSLKEQGIGSIGQLYWIVLMIDRGWQTTNNVTADWLARLVKVLKLLLEMDLKNRKELLPYLLSSFPENLDTIEERIANSLLHLENINKITSAYADMVVRCLSFVIRKGLFSLSEESLRQINALMTPWCFWVVTRAISKTRGPLSINSLNLLIESPVGLRHFSESVSDSNDVIAEVFLSSGGSGPFQTGKKDFSCGLTIQPGGRLIATFACTAEEFYDLVEVISMIMDNKVMAERGCWQIMKDDKHNACTIRKSGVLIPVPLDALNDFMTLVLKLNNRIEIQHDIIREYVERYGAV